MQKLIEILQMSPRFTVKPALSSHLFKCIRISLRIVTIELMSSKSKIKQFYAQSRVNVPTKKPPCTILQIRHRPRHVHDPTGHRAMFEEPLLKLLLVTFLLCGRRRQTLHLGGLLQLWRNGHRRLLLLLLRRTTVERPEEVARAGASCAAQSSRVGSQQELRMVMVRVWLNR